MMDASLPAAAAAAADAQPWMTTTARIRKGNGTERRVARQTVSRAADMILKQDSELTMLRALNPSRTLCPIHSPPL